MIYLLGELPFIFFFRQVWNNYVMIYLSGAAVDVTSKWKFHDTSVDAPKGPNALRRRGTTYREGLHYLKNAPCPAWKCIRQCSGRVKIHAGEVMSTGEATLAVGRETCFAEQPSRSMRGCLVVAGRLTSIHHEALTKLLSNRLIIHLINSTCAAVIE